jgi:hypothetical protein
MHQLMAMLKEIDPSELVKLRHNPGFAISLAKT